MPCSRIARTKPRLLITVATTRVAARRAPTASSASSWSPSTTCTGGVDGEAAVGVAVVGEAEVGAVLDDRGLQRTQVGRAAALVDPVAVAVGVDRDDVGAGPAVGLRGQRARRALRAVDDDAQPGQRAPATAARRCAR